MRFEEQLWQSSGFSPLIIYVHVYLLTAGALSQKEKEQVCPVLKDNDWTESKMKLKLGKVGAKLFIDQVQCVSRIDASQS